MALAKEMMIDDAEMMCDLMCGAPEEDSPEITANSLRWDAVVIEEVFSHYCNDYCIKPASEMGDTVDCAGCTERKALNEVAFVLDSIATDMEYNNGRDEGNE